MAMLPPSENSDAPRWASGCEPSCAVLAPLEGPAAEVASLAVRQELPAQILQRDGVPRRRGLIPVNGKGEMESYILVSRRSADGLSTPP
jgi:hypothetical protein